MRRIGGRLSHAVSQNTKLKSQQRKGKLQTVQQFHKDLVVFPRGRSSSQLIRRADMVAELFPQVILVRNQLLRMRYARNHNMGTRIASGRYVCHLDTRCWSATPCRKWCASWTAS